MSTRFFWQLDRRLWAGNNEEGLIHEEWNAD